MAKKTFLAVLPSLALLFTSSSCSLNLSNWIVKERDFSKLYLGGFPEVTYRGSDEKSDYWMYVSFCPAGTPFDPSSDFTAPAFSPKFDMSFDLNGSSCADYGVGEGLRFFDFGAYWASHSSVGLQDYFRKGSYLSAFTSVGAYVAGADDPCCSLRQRVGASGQFVAFSTIGTNGLPLTCKVSYVYDESLWGGFRA
jgi:hypothetical protein